MPRTPGARSSPKSGSRPASTDAPPPPAAELALAVEDYLAANPTAAVLEDGRILFDMRSARYSVTESHGRCLLQLWSGERNLMRTVVAFAAARPVPAPHDPPHGRSQTPGARFGSRPR